MGANYRVDNRLPSNYQGEPDNPYPPYSGRWHAHNASAHRYRTLTGTGFLYATQRESDRAIKIGMSIQPVQRFISYRCSYSARHDRYSLLWIVEVEGMADRERSLHLALRQYRIQGEREWFWLRKREALLALMTVGNPIYIGYPFETPKESPRYEL